MKIGVNVNFRPGQLGAIEQAAEAGIQWLRIGFPWLRIEKQEGVYDLGWRETFINRALSLGLKLYGGLGYSPQWANGNTSKEMPPLTEHVDAWVKYLKWVVGGHKGTINHWHLWNEPNLKHFYGGTMWEYEHPILSRGYAAIIAANPAAIVGGPHTTHWGGAKEPWMLWLKAALKTQTMQIVAHHIYGEDVSQLLHNLDCKKRCPPWNRFVSLRAFLKKHNAGHLPVWIGETGWNAHRVGETGQAERLVTLFDALQKRPWVDGVFYYQMQDDPNSEGSMGLLDGQGTRRKAWYAIKHWISTH